jgi:hypothetical protein
MVIISILLTSFHANVSLLNYNDLIIEAISNLEQHLKIQRKN